MVEKVETVIVGGGQAGLATSSYLKQHGSEHIVLEKASKPANAWRNDRWDSFTLLTPNWSFNLPGGEYDGQSPDGFMAKDEIIQRFESYVEKTKPPIQYQVEVREVKWIPENNTYLIQAGEKSYQAKNVVMATGLFQKPKIPSFSRNIFPGILQLPAGQYRNPKTLPDGAVLIIGSAQSGAQIAEELYQSGRRVYLCLGTAGRVPRRYRGKDVYDWMRLVGWLDRTVDMLPSPKAKFTANPHVSGRDGGRTLNLHQFARDGVVLLGHIIGAYGYQVGLRPDFKQSLEGSDKFESNLVRQIEEYIENSHITAPREQLPGLKDGFSQEELTELSLQSAGISTIIWAVGYSFDFSMVRLPIFDIDGYPVQKRGVTKYPGLYFIGLPWLHKFQSGHLLGIKEDAAHIASTITANGGVSS